MKCELSAAVVAVAASEAKLRQCDVLSVRAALRPFPVGSDMSMKLDT